MMLSPARNNFGVSSNAAMMNRTISDLLVLSGGTLAVLTGTGANWNDWHAVIRTGPHVAPRKIPFNHVSVERTQVLT